MRNHPHHITEGSEDHALVYKESNRTTQTSSCWEGYSCGLVQNRAIVERCLLSTAACASPRYEVRAKALAEQHGVSKAALLAGPT